MPVGSEARHSASPHAWPWHPVVLKADPLGDTPLPPCPRHLTVCLPLPIKVKNNDPSFSCLMQAGSGMGPGCRSSTQLHGILSGPLAEGSCPGDGPLRPCKVESGTHRKRIVSPWISGGDASSPPLAFRTQILFGDWLYIQPVREGAFYAPENSTAASQAA